MIPARVLTRRDDARVALAVTGLAVAFFAMVLVDDSVHVRLVGGPSSVTYSLVAMAILLGGVAPWLAWTRRGARSSVRLDADGIVAGGVRIARADVTGVSVARGARGSSVAIARGPVVTFLEVERAEDAARIVDALGGSRALAGRVVLPRTSRSLAKVQGALTLACLLCGPMYFLSTVLNDVYPGGNKPLYGLGGLSATVLALLVLVVRRRLPTQAVAVGRGAWDAHVELHGEVGGSDGSDRSDGKEGEAGTGGQEREGETTRALGLARGEEPVRVWLARLDASPNEGHAYRGDAMKKDVLWETLGDEGAPADARMAAARVLALRHSEPRDALVRVVVDPDVRLRVEAAMEEEEEDAERRIDRLGPLFRAR